MSKLTVIFLLTSQIVFSQLGRNKDVIFEKENQNYIEKVVFDDYTIYNFNGSKIQTPDGYNCPEILTYYINNNTEECFQVTYSTCSRAVNTYVKMLNKLAVQIETYKWKDYQNNSVYIIEIDGPFMQLLHYWE